MNVNKKLDRLKQWAGERLGGEVKTNVSDDFKALEAEMTLRYEGMERLQKSMTAYVKSLAKRNEVEEKEKTLPVAYLGSTMLGHGEDFDDDSKFGQCLIGMGGAHEWIARLQETYVVNATSSWLVSLERSLAQMKEYQAARKKLENRRLAYDASLAKMQKAKKEDFRIEEELRSHKAKYVETNEDVYRRMQDIQEAEVDSITDLEVFLDAELSYHNRCHEILLQLKKEWPEVQSGMADQNMIRSRSNTVDPYVGQYSNIEPGVDLPACPSIRSSRTVSSSQVQNSPIREAQKRNCGSTRPTLDRSATFEGPTRIYRDSSPSFRRMTRVPSDSLTVLTKRAQLGSLHKVTTGNSLFDDPSDTSTFNSNSTSSLDRYFSDRAASPATSQDSSSSRTISSSTLNGFNSTIKKIPPPPPPPRGKKPPPPPPMKKSALSNIDTKFDQIL